MTIVKISATTATMATPTTTQGSMSAFVQTLYSEVSARSQPQAQASASGMVSEAK